MAFKYWKMAAEQGEANAQGNIGHMYYAGEGVQKNLDEAFK